MKKIVVLVSLLIVVFSLSGCTIGRLDEIPPRAFDEEYIKESSEVGAELGTLTADYIKNVLATLGIEFKSGGEIADEVEKHIPSAGEITDKVNEYIPSVGEIQEEIDKVLPSEGEILNKTEEVSEEVSDELKEKFTESMEVIGESVN